MNFLSEAEECRKELNNWVARKTEEKIQNLFPSGTLTEDTKFVIVNALYFKGWYYVLVSLNFNLIGLWASPFNKLITRDGPFTLLNGTEKQVPKMSRNDKNMNYGEFTSLEA